MSWSISFTGKGAAVAKKIREYAQKPDSKCAEPEETVRQETLEACAKCADSLPNIAVTATANGSMWRDTDTVRSHTVSMNVSTIGNFVE